MKTPLYAFVLALCLSPLLRAEDYGKINISSSAGMTLGNSGETEHGYAAHTFRISNKDTKPHRIAVTLPSNSFDSNGVNLDRLSNYVDVPKESSAELTLLQPPVYLSGSNEATVFIDNNKQRNKMATLAYRHMPKYGVRDATAVVLTSQGVPPGIHNRFMQGMPSKPEENNEQTTGGAAAPVMPSTSMPVMTLGSPPSTPIVKTEVSPLPVSGWSDNWLAYTSFDAVAITSDEWKELQGQHPAIFKAIRLYTEAGGVLLITGKDWTAPKEWTQHPGSPALYNAVFGTVFVMDRDEKRAASQIEPFRIHVLAGAALWRDAIGSSRHSGRYGFYGSSTSGKGTGTMLSGNTPLLNSLPAVENFGISVRAVLALILIFAVLIGPVNIFTLNKMKRRIWLLWTVPAISFAASVLVFGVSFLQEGFIRQASSSTLTVLDQRRETALSCGFLGYYATLTPNGFVFSPNTEVTACLDRDYYSSSSRSLNADTMPDGSQRFTGEWITARVPAYFMVRKAETMRKERMLFDWAAEKPTATNGLGVSLDSLTVCAADGKIYKALNIKAGEKVELSGAGEVSTSEERQRLLTLLENSYTSTLRSGILPGSASMPSGALLPNTYIAEASVWNPFIENGIERMKPYQNKTVIYGVFE